MASIVNDARSMVLGSFPMHLAFKVQRIFDVSNWVWL